MEPLTNLCDQSTDFRRRRFLQFQHQGTLDPWDFLPGSFCGPRCFALKSGDVSDSPLYPLACPVSYSPEDARRTNEEGGCATTHHPETCCHPRHPHPQFTPSSRWSGGLVFVGRVLYPRLFFSVFLSLVRCEWLPTSWSLGPRIVTRPSQAGPEVVALVAWPAAYRSASMSCSSEESGTIG